MYGKLKLFPLISYNTNILAGFIIVSQPSKDSLTDYSRRVEFLRGLIVTEKMVINDKWLMVLTIQRSNILKFIIALSYGKSNCQPASSYG